jgi:hypothetical protein
MKALILRIRKKKHDVDAENPLQFSTCLRVN